MPALFSHQRGTVVRLDSKISGGPLPFAIRMHSMDVGSNRDINTRAIITQAAIVENGNYQFLHTLDETIYLYVFGDRIGELRISGVAFSQLCLSTGEEADDETGMEQVIRNYRDNRIAARARPVLVTFGADVPLRSFLTGMSVEITDPEQMLGQWSYRFNAFPGRG